MINFLIRIVLRRYMKQNREINKLDEAVDYDYFLFKTPEHTEKLIKTLLTTQTLLHFEAKTEEEKLLVKGGALMLKFIRDCHYHALSLKEVTDEATLKREWRKLRYKNFYN